METADHPAGSNRSVSGGSIPQVGHTYAYYTKIGGYASTNQFQVGLAESTCVAVFAGNKRGIIYVQGERVANVKEEEILERLLAECKRFEDKVNRGEARLGQKTVEIVPPAPIGELGSGAEKIASGDVEQITIGES